MRRLAARCSASRPAVEVPALIERLFPTGFEEQREAAEIALSQAVTVLTGGPGTGKTTTVARLLALLAEQADLPGGGAAADRAGRADRQGGRAAARGGGRMRWPSSTPPTGTRLAELHAMTLHRLLGSGRIPRRGFGTIAANRLPHDVIVVDETSMVSLTMMARLLEAVRPDARLVLVGDADQLASVEAGAVLADLVDGLSARDGRAGGGAADLAPVRGIDRHAGRCDPGWRRGSGDWRCCGRAMSTSSSSIG